MISRNLERERTKRRVLPWGIVASFLLHGAAFAALRAAPASARAERRKTELSFDVVERERPKALEPPPAPKPEPPKPKPRALEPKLEAKRDRAPPVPEPKLPAPSSGVTLAADGVGNAFSMPLGNGGSLEPTPFHAPQPLDLPARIAPAVPPVVAELALVAIGDLSARPSPPALATALEQNYPADARRRGLSGTAKVRARIDPDGVVRRVSLVEESASGFGSACSRTLSGSRWGPPKDKAGRSVATEIRYTCRFVVEP